MQNVQCTILKGYILLGIVVTWLSYIFSGKKMSFLLRLFPYHKENHRLCILAPSSVSRDYFLEFVFCLGKKGFVFQTE